MKKYTKTLVLDSSYMPRSIISSLRAFVVVIKGNAAIVEEHDCNFKLVNPNTIIKKPSVIRVQKYVNTRHNKVPLTRENVFKRDGNMCVYCGDDNIKTLTIDHVVPQSKRGGNTWDNLVTACKRCNGEKADLSLEEFGKEIPVPKRPHYLMLMKSIEYIPEEWKKYMFFSV
jgi:5-methylcytosine-specific restriction endonuclease McrA